MRLVEGWQPRTLSDLADFINGFAFKPDDWSKDGLPIVRIEQLKNPDAPTDHYSGKLPAAQMINNGDLIFSWSASLFLRIWRHGPAALNQHLFKVVERESVDRSFLKSFIEFYLPELTRASHGSTMQHITRKELNRFSAQFPVNKCEQGKIAEIFSTVDWSIKQTEALIAKQQRIKTGLMQDLLRRGIDENGDVRSEGRHGFKDSPLGRIPASWSVKTLADCVEFLDAKRIPLKQEDRDTIEGDYPYYGASGIIDYIDRYIFDEDLILVGEDGENLVSRKLPLAFRVGGRIWVNNHAHVLKPRPRHDIDFLVERLEFYDYRLLVSGSTQPKLNQRRLRKMTLPIPPADEQTRIGQVFAQHNHCYNETLAALKKLRLLKIALMQDLLTGKRRVTALLGKPELTSV
jgi:type I restriction enzyme, S subunit